jgi:DNA-binding Lrp family transcriptional regulator
MNESVLDDLDRRIINDLQGGFPICEHPYRVAAEQLDIDENTLIDRLGVLLEKGLLSRFGPMYHAERLGGGLTLAAMCVPDENFDQVAEQVNAFAEVAHNYQRDHELNMWFVLATETPDEINSIIKEIEKKTGLSVYNMPKQEEFFIGLKIDV